MRLGLLECDDVVGRFAHLQGGYREMFAALLPGFDFGYYEAHRGRLPASPGECDAWLCTGSKFAVYEEHEWLPPLSSFIRRIAEAERPFVGICFGHQLLAHAMGGRIAKASTGWGVGVLSVEVVREEPWMRPAAKRIRIPHLHQDQIQNLPEGSVLLGRSPHCDVGMFRIGERLLGIEGHPEFTPEFSRALITARRESIGEAGARAALKSLEAPADGALVGQWIAAFIRSGRRRSRSA